MSADGNAVVGGKGTPRTEREIFDFDDLPAALKERAWRSIHPLHGTELAKLYRRSGLDAAILAIDRLDARLAAEERARVLGYME